MHDPKFEKDVQQKMAELEFSPPESVWRNVEKAMNNRHSRRSLPFFWRMALPGLLLLAAGGYYFFRVTPASPATATQLTHSVPRENVSQDRNATAPLGTFPPATTVAPASGSASSSQSAGQSDAQPAGQSDAEPAGRLEAQPAGQLHAHPETQLRTHPETRLNAQSDQRSETLSRGRLSRQQDVAAQFARKADGQPAKRPGSGNRHGSTTTGGDQPLVAANNLMGNSDPTAVDRSATRNSYLLSPLTLANLHSDRSMIRAGKLAPRKSASTVRTLQAPKRSWEAAFSGGAGVSTLHQTTKISNYALQNAASPNSQSAPANNVTALAARPTKRYVSEVGPGISFRAGLLAQRPLSARWALSLGLDLSYYSNSIRVGQQVDNYALASTPQFATASFAPVQSYPYYAPGDERKYTNRYYFLELPVGVEWKINHSKLLPLFLNGGFSLSYLMASSAVYYNTQSGVYFKDAGAANRTQFNLSTSLMVGLPFHGIRAQVGPQIQYGVTSLLNTELSGAQHLFYGGIRFVVFPGKK